VVSQVKAAVMEFYERLTSTSESIRSLMVDSESAEMTLYFKQKEL
tara:strand:- start:31248 stop:31382 length:135 start_codon:yes stop_codon:yes gene_type:complete